MPREPSLIHAARMSAENNASFHPLPLDPRHGMGGEDLPADGGLEVTAAAPATVR